jgi:hypothetical protein
MKFSRTVLPILGIRYEYFATQRQATRFQAWVAKETAASSPPYHTTLEHDPACTVGPWIVKVTNW